MCRFISLAIAIGLLSAPTTSKHLSVVRSQSLVVKQAVSDLRLLMQKTQKIRATVLGWIRHGDRVFVAEGYDSGRQCPFYRALGGGIEFGETSLDALKREFMEEIQAELINIQHLCCIENLFTFEGNPGHEIIQLYECEFADPTFYQLEHVTVYEGKSEGVAYWIDRDRFKSGELRLVPELCLNYL